MKKILFWTRKDAPSTLFDALVEGCLLRDPAQHVRADVPAADRRAVAHALSNGTQGIAYMGRAECRICGVELGNADIYGYGFIWPEKAEHYVLEHHVWTPECEELLAVIRRAS